MIFSWCKDKAPRFQKISFSLYCITLILLPLQIRLPKIGMQAASLCLLITLPLALLGFGRSCRPGAITFAALAFFFTQFLANIANRQGLDALLNLKGFLSLFILMEMTRIYAGRFRLTAILNAWLMGSALTVWIGMLAFLLALFGQITPWVRAYEHFPYFGAFPRILSTFGNPTALNVYLIVGIFLVSVKRDMKFPFSLQDRLLDFCHLPLAILVGFLSLSKIVLFTLGGLLLFRKRYLAAVLFAAALLLPLGVFSVVNPHESKMFVGLFPQQSVSISFFERNLWWIPTNYAVAKWASVKIFLEHPFFGAGSNHFQLETFHLVQDEKLPAGIVGFNPHSTYLGIASEGGLLGILGLLIFLGVLFQTSSRLSQTHFFASKLQALGLTLLLIGVNTDLLRFPALWFFMGLLASLPQIEKSGYTQV